MTTTLVTNAQSIGTSTNIGEDKFVTKTTLQTGTTAFIVCGRVTNGSTGACGNQGLTLRIWYTTASFTYSANAAGIDALRQTARFVDIPLRNGTSKVALKDSSLEPVTGASVFVWCEVPTLTVAASLDINLVEVP